MYLLLKNRLQVYREVRVVRKSPLFNKDWYLHRYPDVKNRKIDPAWHYCMFGWREGRQPCPDFDSVAYLQINSDVKDAGTNPLYHYERYGRGENRPINGSFQSSNVEKPQTSAVAFSNLDSDIQEEKSMPQGQFKVDNSSSQIKLDISENHASMRHEVLNSGFWDEDWYLSHYYDKNK